MTVPSGRALARVVDARAVMRAAVRARADRTISARVADVTFARSVEARAVAGAIERARHERAVPPAPARLAHARAQRR